MDERIESAPGNGKAVIEEPQSGSGQQEHNPLEYRLRQQRILAEFGMLALRTRDIGEIVSKACEMCADAMNAKFSKYLEYDARTEDLLLRAGVGWKPGIVGHMRIADDLRSPAGYAFHTGTPVISNELDKDDRFRTPDFMREHGIRRAVNVLVEGEGRRLGVIEVDSRDGADFSEPDLTFMQGFANLIGVAIERCLIDEELSEARAYQETLTRESSHRVKNSLSMVSAMLQMQRNQQEDDGIRAILADAHARVMTIAEAHDELWQSDAIGRIRIGPLLARLATGLSTQQPGVKISCESTDCEIDADIAIPLGLLATELLTNAIKYAYPSGKGAVRITFDRDGDTVKLTVSDDGIGMPVNFDFERLTSRSLGMRLVKGISHQLDATLHFRTDRPGTTVVTTVPLNAKD